MRRGLFLSLLQSPRPIFVQHDISNQVWALSACGGPCAGVQQQQYTQEVLEQQLLQRKQQARRVRQRLQHEQQQQQQWRRQAGDRGAAAPHHRHPTHKEEQYYDGYASSMQADRKLTPPQPMHRRPPSKKRVAPAEALLPCPAPKRQANAATTLGEIPQRVPVACHGKSVSALISDPPLLAPKEHAPM